MTMASSKSGHCNRTYCRGSGHEVHDDDANGWHGDVLTICSPQEKEYLLAKTVPITIPDHECIRLLQQKMATTNAVGLHARQIKQGNNVFVVKIPDGPEYLFIGAKNVSLSGDVLYDRESCLSEVDEYGRPIPYFTPRNKVVEFETEDGMKHRFEDFTARVIQHELDHGNGVLLATKPDTKNMSPERKQALPGRNDPCLCGRLNDKGQPIKFKKCCGKAV